LIQDVRIEGIDSLREKLAGHGFSVGERALHQDVRAEDIVTGTRRFV
jgi:hypothetical protein